jgi:hypothetical protein
LQVQAVAFATAVNAPDKLPDLFKSRDRGEAPEVGRKWWKPNEGQRRGSGDSE